MTDTLFLFYVVYIERNAIVFINFTLRVEFVAL